MEVLEEGEEGLAARTRDLAKRRTAAETDTCSGPVAMMRKETRRHTSEDVQLFVSSSVNLHQV